MKKVYLLLWSIVLLGACEKDDICDPGTPTTPRLVIEFFDVANPAIPRAVTNLKVIATGMEEGVILNETATVEADRYVSNGSKISIPLRTLANNIQYSFIFDSRNSNEDLIYTDVLDFNYSKRDEYVSRACGFKTLFTLNPDGSATDAVILNNNPDAEEGNWIKGIEISESNIETENETHVKIFF